MADQDMDQEIREASGGDLKDNIETVEGTKQFAPAHPTDGSVDESKGSNEIPGTDSPEAQQAREEFPRASEEEVIETAEAAKASFGGTGGMGGGGVESEADPAIATGQKPGMGSESQEASGDAPTREEVDNAPDISDISDENDEGEGEGKGMTTGQKFASILGSDPNMKMESKIAEKLSGGDDKNTEGL